MIKEKILILKTGYTEVLDAEQNSRVASLGDVLRTTSLLHKYKDDHVTWVTSDIAFPLLTHNSYIDRLLVFDLITSLQLESEEFDKIINLEKVPGICALSDKIKARRIRYGFTFNTQTGKAEALDRCYEVLAISDNIQYKKRNIRNLQELLFELIGEKFNGEEYILGYKPKTKEIYDIGFNTQVGSKWPSKAWPMKNWDRLEKIIGEEFSVSRQEKQNDKILGDIYSYIDWLNSCKTIISNDSLGLHIALALKKKVLGLFGSTSPQEVYFYGRGKAIIPKGDFDCMPCFKPQCSYPDLYCMDNIFVKEVYDEIK